MSVRKDIVELIKVMTEEELEAVRDYIYFLRDPEQVEPTREEREALIRGRAEYAHGDYVRWRDIKGSEN
jgi:PHD/YefM family antitoxin component YafN of YafNO toxin-antitoxin module